MKSWFLLSLLLLSGCQRAPKIGGPSQLVFHECQLPQKAGLCLGLAYSPIAQRLTAVNLETKWNGWVSSSSDGGKTFESAKSFAQLYSGTLGSYPMDDFRVLDQNERTLICHNDYEQGFALKAWSGSSWEDMPHPKWEKGFRQFGAGAQRLLLVGHSEAGKTSLFQSDDSGSSWSESQWTPPTPQHLTGSSVDPLDAGTSPVTYIDSRDRIHLLVEDTHLRTSKQTQDGCLYVRSEDGKSYESQFFEGKFSFRSALGGHLQEADTVYLATAEEQPIEGQKERILTPYRLSLRVSSDGGKRWQAPLHLDHHRGIKQRLSVGGSNSEIFLSWIDQRSDDPGIYLCNSRDKGRSWSAPQKVCDPCETYQMVVTPQSVLIVSIKPAVIWRADFSPQG